MQFLSDNAAAVHPKVWAAMQAADTAQPPYDNDRLSQSLDEAFSALFGRRCVAQWVATGTAANSLALAGTVAPHRGVICHEDAHILNDECGAPGFYTHGAALMPVAGKDGRITPEAIDALTAPIRRDVHRVWPQAISITQATEAGTVYTPPQIAAIAAKAEKEAAYHVRHCAEWVIRLGDGTAESHRRIAEALIRLWPFTGEMFEVDAGERGLIEAGLIPDAARLREGWRHDVAAILNRATLEMPADGWMQQGGRDGRHTEAFGHLLSELQYVQRAYPGATW